MMFATSPTSHCPLVADDNNVLDLRVYKQDEMVPGQLTPPRDGSPPMGVAPALAITQRVLAAAQAQHTRPFKAYPKDPLSLSTAHDESYMRFREEMLSQVRGQKAGQRKRPASPPQSPDSKQESSGEDKDAAYWERRRKNNEAAKRSRDARRAKEDEIAIRAAFLEQENLKLKYQLAMLSEETAHLRCMMYKDHQPPVLVRYPHGGHVV